MSEKEEKAINELKSRREYFEYQPEGCNWRLSFDEEEVHTIIDVIINLIDKQQKEIEERDKKDNMQVIYGGRRFGTEGMVVKDYISKAKIREKIKELENKNEENKIELTKGIDMLSFSIIEKARNNIEINMTLRDILKELLEETNAK